MKVKNHRNRSGMKVERFKAGLGVKIIKPNRAKYRTILEEKPVRG